MVKVFGTGRRLARVGGLQPNLVTIDAVHRLSSVLKPKKSLILVSALVFGELVDERRCAIGAEHEDTLQGCIPSRSMARVFAFASSLLRPHSEHDEDAFRVVQVVCGILWLWFEFFGHFQIAFHVHVQFVFKCLTALLHRLLLFVGQLLQPPNRTLGTTADCFVRELQESIDVNVRIALVAEFLVKSVAILQETDAERKGIVSPSTSIVVVSTKSSTIFFAKTAASSITAIMCLPQ